MRHEAGRSRGPATARFGPSFATFETDAVTELPDRAVLSLMSPMPFFWPELIYGLGKMMVEYMMGGPRTPGPLIAGLDPVGGEGFVLEVL
jgi:hypothetical protein